MRKTDEGAARRTRRTQGSWGSTMTLGLWSLGETIELAFGGQESGSLGAHIGSLVVKFMLGPGLYYKNVRRCDQMVLVLLMRPLYHVPKMQICWLLCRKTHDNMPK